MTRDDEGAELVANVAVGHRCAVLVTRGEQHSEDIRSISSRPVLVDEALELRVGVVGCTAEARIWAENAELALEPRHEEKGRMDGLEHAEHAPPDGLHLPSRPRKGSSHTSVEQNNAVPPQQMRVEAPYPK